MVLSVEVVFALPHAAELRAVELKAGACVRDAVEASGLLVAHPEIDSAQAAFGIFGKLVDPDARLKPGDRVEIYRPLKADPKEVRRRRAAEGKAMRKGSARQA